VANLDDLELDELDDTGTDPSDDDIVGADPEDGDPEGADDPTRPSPGKGEDIDWRQRYQEMERRFKGLQPVVQREVEAKRQAEAKALELEARLLQAQIAALPEEDQPLARYQAEQQITQRYNDMQRQQELAVMYAVAKNAKVAELVKKYGKHGVTADDLTEIDFGSPEDMERFAAKLARKGRNTSASQRRQERREAGADAFESGGSPVAPGVKEPTNYAEARELFRQLATRRRK
jgi:hypothetical protein